MWSDIIIALRIHRNRLTAKAGIGIATSQHVDAKINVIIRMPNFTFYKKTNLLNILIVGKLHGKLRKKRTFGESVHEAKETILVNDHVT